MSAIGASTHGDAEGGATRPSVSGRVLRLPLLALAAFVTLAVFTAIFWKWTATSAWGFPRFLVAVLVLGYVPGRALLDLGRLRLRPLDGLTLSLLTGLTSGAFLFWVLGLLNARPAMVLWPLAAAVVYWGRRRGRWRALRGVQAPLRASHVLLAAVMVVCFMPLLVLPTWYRTLSVTPQGGMAFPSSRDTLFHLSIVNELTHAIPPQSPFLAGTPLNYHYGMHLASAMFSYCAGLSPADLTVRFMPTLFMALSVLAVFCLGRAWLGSGRAAALMAFLVIWGEDFSFIPGLCLGSSDYWSVVFFQVPTSFSLYFINPMLPGLGILFGGLFCLVKYCREGGGAWAVLAAFLFSALVEFKIFAAAQVLVALVATSAVFLVFFRDRQPLKVLGLTIALVVPLLLYLRLAAGDEAGRLVTGELARAPLIPMSFTAMGLGNTHLVRGLTRFSNGEATSVHAALRFFLVGVPVFLLGSLGLRLLAVPAVLKDVFTPSSHSAHRFFIASFVVCGIIVGLFTKMTCEHAEPYNNSVWFYSLSKYVAWVFVVEVLWAVLRGKRAVVQAFILCVVAGLSVPSTVQFLYLQMSCKSVALGRNVVGAMTFLRERCAPGDVAFTREGLTEPVLAMTKCRVPVSRIAIAPTSEAEAARREEDVHDFWLPMCSERRRGEILRRYKADYLILDRRADQRKPPASGVDTGPLFENDDLAVYRALQ